MKTCDCHCDTPRDGSGQRGRYLKALDPSYAPIDGRSLEDLLVFAERYAKLIRFYDIPDSKVAEPADPKQKDPTEQKPADPQQSPAAQADPQQGSPTSAPPPQPSWVEFFRRDLAVIAASIAVVDTAQIKREYDKLRTEVDADPSRATLRALFGPILDMARQIDGWHRVATDGNPLRADLDLAIASSLRGQVAKLRSYEKAFEHEAPADPLKLDYSTVAAKLWGLDQPADADRSVYQGAEFLDRIRNVALYVDDVFHAFYGFMSDLVTVKSVGYMTFALESYPAHQPHMALFIAFVELFRLAQDQMNGLTARMLDFYYQDILHLTPKPAIPDRVHIVFELAKDVVEYDVSQGTALRGGKDAGGKDLTYKTMVDLVVNQAKVKEVENVLIKKTKQPPATPPDPSTIDAIFARPIANSLDGFGEKIADPSGKWFTFGQDPDLAELPQTLCQKIAGLDEAADSRKDQAQFGFALASPQLLLQGGNRLITWHVDGLKSLLPDDHSKKGLKISLTTSKGSLEVGHSELKPMIAKLAKDGIFPEGVTQGYDSDDHGLFIFLPVSADAIVPFDPALHGGPLFQTTHPVAQVIFEPSLLRVSWTTRDIGRQWLSVQVGSINREFVHTSEAPKLHFDGLKALVLQNQTGLLAADKPFDPFTLFPQYGKSFYIGGEELVTKPFPAGAPLTVNIKTTTDPETEIPVSENYHYSVSVSDGGVLNRVCTITDTGPTEVFSRGDLSWTILFHGPIGSVTPLSLDRLPIGQLGNQQIEMRERFIRITLLGDADHRGVLDMQASQKLAPQLEIKEISVNYLSLLPKFESGVEQFFHVYPFGVTEVFFFEGSLEGFPKETVAQKAERAERLGRFVALDAAKDGLLVNPRQFFMPQFTFVGANEAYRFALDTAKRTATAVAGKSRCETFIESLVDAAAKPASAARNSQYSGNEPEQGMLLIGLANLRPLDTLSLLFQFAEGSAIDEDNDPPEIHWSYLTDNEWRPLKGENLISDGTYGFQTTGIVKIDVPEDSTDNNTIVTKGLRWFQASVTEHTDRVPMLVNIVAQAAEAKLQDNDNDPSHFDRALPAGSISKLAAGIAEIAKVGQPFASFDGKHREIGKEFYTRVSERLRHKARAVTAWDYEHLVLDRFPSIYKVKCIAHTDPNCLCRKPSDPMDKECCGPQIAPGHVLVVPVSNLKNRNAVNPLQPKTSRRTLLEIQDYLARRTSPFVHVQARNPVYEQILVFFQVQFTEGTNKGYYLKKLNEEIVHYLTPWAFDDEAEVSFAQKVYASAIINFVEERPYVDFITDFFMFVCRDECCPKAVHTTDSATDLTEVLSRMSGCCDVETIFADKGRDFICEIVATPATSRSILVSAPRHIIIPYEAPPTPSPCEKKAQLPSPVNRLAPSEPPAIATPAKRSARKAVDGAGKATAKATGKATTKAKGKKES